MLVCLRRVLRWPPQIDVDRASRKLLETYQSARALPSQFLGCVQQATPTPSLFAKRLQSLDKDRMVWLAQAQQGEVRYVCVCVETKGVSLECIGLVVMCGPHTQVHSATGTITVSA